NTCLFAYTASTPDKKVNPQAAIIAGLDVMNHVVPDYNAERCAGSANCVDAAKVGKQTQSDMVNIIGFDHGAHGSLIPCAGDDSCIWLVVDVIMGNNIIIANAD